MDTDIVLTCEHAGNSIPEPYRYLFAEGSGAILNSHRGWDPGAWEVAAYIAGRLDVPLYGCHTSRLLIEVNRSLHHGQLFSEFTDPLPTEEKEILIREIYRPYRESVVERLKSAQGQVLHLSVHTFTPVLHGKVRPVEIGLLFDPASPLEAGYCHSLHGALQERLTGLRIAFNEPYRGIDDGLTTSLREVFPPGRYAGIEIELNQKLIGDGSWAEIKDALAVAVKGLRSLPPDL